MNKQWIEAFVHVAKTGNVSQSAKQLFLTQPSVSGRIQSLEQAIGQPLFIRTDRGMVLSDAGNTFFPFAEKLLDSWDKGLAAVRELGTSLSGSLTVALFYSAIPLLAPCLNAFQSRYPDIKLSVKSRHSEEVGDLLLNREAQIGIARSLSNQALQSTPLLQNRYVFVIAADHPQALALQSPENDAADVPIIQMCSSQFDKEVFNRFVEQCSFALSIIAESDNLEVCRQFVLAHNGAALLPLFYVSSDLRERRMIQLDTLSSESFSGRSIDIVWLKRQPDNRIIKAFRAFVIDYMAQISKTAQ